MFCPLCRPKKILINKTKKIEFKWFLNVFKKQVTRPFAVLNLLPSLLSLSPDFPPHYNAKRPAPTPPKKRGSESQRENPAWQW